MPSILHNYQGEERKVGVEFEFVGVDLDTASKIITDLFGGTYKKTSRFYGKVENETYGDFTLELDARLLRDKAYESFLGEFGIRLNEYFIGERSLQDSVENLLENIASSFVPYEISTPPVPISQIDLMDRLNDGLRQNKAKGTKAFFMYAFGLHFNIQVVDETLEEAIRYLRAFVLLYPWIFKNSSIDLARRITPYIDEFPRNYLELLLDKNYTPDLKKFANDYYRFNPTRNRPLDMYPLLAYMDYETVSSTQDMNMVSPRPALHYRLPNCQTDEPEWSVAREWNLWIAVEELAQDPEKIEAMSREFLKTQNYFILNFTEKWIRRTSEWINTERYLND